MSWQWRHQGQLLARCRIPRFLALCQIPQFLARCQIPRYKIIRSLDSTNLVVSQHELLSVVHESFLGLLYHLTHFRQSVCHVYLTVRVFHQGRCQQAAHPGRGDVFSVC